MAAYAEPTHVGNCVELDGWLAEYSAVGVKVVHFGGDPVLGVRVLALACWSSLDAGNTDFGSCQEVFDQLQSGVGDLLCS
jgi:hypothetical protein